MGSGARSGSGISSLPYAALASCRACLRLVRHLDAMRLQFPGYHCAPVRAWGSPRSRLLIVGLAPGLHGANRTGRPFTGDASGYFLFDALRRMNLVTHSDPARARLRGIRITNAVRCLPPGNRPSMAELRRCSPYLQHELHQLWRPTVRRPRCVLALGRLAHQAVGLALDLRPAAFEHGAAHPLAPNLWLVDTYHPSRQNTNTGRLTAPMLDRALDTAVSLLHS